jgi:hypothetical protein
MNTGDEWVQSAESSKTTNTNTNATSHTKPSYLKDLPFHSVRRGRKQKINLAVIQRIEPIATIYFFEVHRPISIGSETFVSKDTSSNRSALEKPGKRYNESL